MYETLTIPKPGPAKVEHADVASAAIGTKRIDYARPEEVQPEPSDENAWD